MVISTDRKDQKEEQKTVQMDNLVELKKAEKSRCRVLAIALFCFILLLFLGTVAKLSL